jgi:hypothetical protein
VSRLIGLLLLGILVVAGVLYLVYRNNDDTADKLPHHYESHSGLALSYPKGWTVREIGLNTLIANRMDVLDSRTPTQSGDVFVSIRPPLPIILYNRNNAPLTTILNSFARQLSDNSARTFNNAQAVTIGEYDAARAALIDPALEGFALLIRISDDQMVLLYATGILGAQSTWENTVLDIADSIRYAQ